MKRPGKVILDGSTETTMVFLFSLGKMTQILDPGLIGIIHHSVQNIASCFSEATKKKTFFAFCVLMNKRIAFCRNNQNAILAVYEFFD